MYRFILQTTGGLKFISIILVMTLMSPAVAQKKVPDEETKKQEEVIKPQNSNSEYQTLFGDDVKYGGYGGLSMGYTNISDYNAVSFGAQGAWIIGHGVAIGLAGRAFITESTDYNSTDEWEFLGGGYGGLLIEPIFLGKQPIHFTTPVIIGLGGVSYSNSALNEWDYYEEFYEWDEFFVIEPGIELEMNITKFFRLAAGVSYRFASDVEISYQNPISSVPGSTDILDDLNGFNYKLCFKFGRF